MRLIMKKLLYIIPAFALFATAGCNKNLEEGPLENLDSSFIWDPVDKNGTYAEQFLNDIYGNMPNGFNRIGNDMLDAATDDALPSQLSSPINELRFGRIDAFGNPEDVWASRYATIRKANVFLGSIDKVPMDAETKGFWKAEARFLRAFAYFELLKRYGGVPLVGDKVGTLADDFLVPRNTYAECVNYISGELDAIKTLVREAPVEGGDFGRISNAAVLALQARLHLYSASPLFNAGNLQPGNPLTGHTDVSDGAVRARWQKAADVAKELMDLNAHSLESKDKYIDVFIDRDSKEIILSYLRANTSDVEQDNGPVGYTKFGHKGYTSPTEELAEAFLMTSGSKPITDPTSGYDPEKPADGRDLRFAKVFFYNGTVWMKRPVETFTGGLDRPGGNQTQTQTGYYLRKFMYDAEKSTSLGTQPHNFPLFRYAEVLLNYAEALNEAAPAQAAPAEAVAALNQVRARGNLSAIVAANVDKVQLRALIRNERRVELCFEEHRYWDIRRWKIAGIVLNQPLHGQDIVRADDGTLTFTKVAVAQNTFSDRMYLYAIPQQEIYRNSKLVQNPLW